ncbi:MAG: sensor histidine kinase [Pedosphaera sp.]|nr:sensor histidine kinase [Pedosphaera sp.]
MNRFCYLTGFACLLLARMAGGEESVVLTKISEVRELSREEAKKNYAVHLRGVVTWPGGTDGGNNWFIFQDDSGGITINMDFARREKFWSGHGTNSLILKVGDEVEIDGVARAAGFAPNILPKRLEVLGTKPLPPARLMVPSRFFAGSDACERIEVRGVVQGYEVSGPDVLTLQMDANPGCFTVETFRTVVKNPKHLVDAEVRIRGVAGTYFNSRGEVAGVRLLVSQPDDLVVEKPANSSPFAAVPLAINQLLPFRPEPLGPHRQLVEGTVIYAQSGQIFYIQDGDTSVRVETLSPETLVPGAHVQVAGFVDMQRHLAGVIGAVVRKVGAASVPGPASITPGEILALNTKAMLSGRSPEPSDFDGRLITFRGRLLNVQPTLDKKPPWYRVTLDADGTIVEALTYKADTTGFYELKPGSELQVTGIALLEYDVSLQKERVFQNAPIGLQILLRGAQDVVVLHSPPWWTPQRFVEAIIVGCVMLTGVMLWTWQLHRQLARKTKLLATEMHARRDASIEFKATLRERNRLAVNLHDTLLQTMSGLCYQLEACEVESLPQAERKANHLETARRMVLHAQESLRGTVWALRVLPLHERTFAEAIRVLANQLSEGRRVKITVTADDELPALSEFVAGNLLLVAQEAMHNALKHAHPTHIETIVTPSSDKKHIILEIKDNGTGFNLQSSPSENSGHFGLVGMRERVERLGGTLKIETQRDNGTRVIAEVSLRPFDEELARL